MCKRFFACLAALLLASCGGGGVAVDAITGVTAAPLRAGGATPAPLRAAGTDPLAQSGFESGMEGWVDWGNSQVVDGAGAAGSSRALRVGTGAGGAASSATGLVAGATYRLTGQLKVSAPTEVAYLGVYFLDASGVKLGERAAPASSTGYALTTVDITAPASASVAVVYVWKNAGSGYAFLDDVVLARATATTPDPANLLSNAGFDAGMTHWVNWGNAAIEGAAPALRVGIAAGGAAQEVAIAGGATYRLAAQARVGAPSENAFLGVYLVDAGGTKVAEQMVPISSLSSSVATVDIAAPANAARAVVYVWKNAGSGYVYVDDVALTLAAGSTTPPPAANLLANPGFESGMAGWTDWGNSLAAAAQANSGSSAARVGTAAGGFGQHVEGILPGQIYRLSAAAKVSDAAEVVYLGVSFFDAAGTKLLEQSVQTSSTSYGPAKLDVVAPPNASRALVYVWKNAGSGHAYVDDFVLERAGADLVLNGGFESQLAHWEQTSTWGDPEVTMVTDAASGTYAVGLGPVESAIAQFVSLVPGQRYRLSAQLKVGDPATGGCLCVAVWETGPGGNVLQWVVLPLAATGGGYADRTIEFTAPLTGVSGSIYVTTYSGLVYADNISLVPAGPADPSAGYWDY